MKLKDLGRVLGLAVLAAAPMFAAGAARADDIDCQPERVRTANDRIDTRCVGVERWFVALRSDTDAQHLNQMLALLNAAIVAGKPLKLYYDLDGDTGKLWAVEMFP